MSSDEKKKKKQHVGIGLMGDTIRKTRLRWFGPIQHKPAMESLMKDFQCTLLAKEVQPN